MKTNQHSFEYIQTPRVAHSTVERIDTILETRMKEFLLSRRQAYWIKYGK